MTDRRLEEKPACSITSAPFPTEEKCQACGYDTEVKCGQFGSLFNNSEK